jgi:iron complex transport system ATP-binding protein
MASGTFALGRTRRDDNVLNPAPALHIERLSWSPASTRTRSFAGAPLLRDITLDVGDGEFVGLIGPNGSGKSSLLHCAFRYAKPHEGKVWLDQTDIWTASPRWVAQRIAVLLQEAPDDFGLTVGQVARMGRTPHKRLLDGDTPDDERLFEQALRDVALWRERDRLFGSLSGGEKQRALLARAFVQQPRVLMLDEPTNHLDLRHQIELLSLVRKRRITTLATIHDLNLAAAFCDRLYVIANGAIVSQGSPHEVLQASMLKTVFGVEACVDLHPVLACPRITPFHRLPSMP